MEVHIKILTLLKKILCSLNFVNVLHRYAMNESVLTKGFLTADIVLWMYVNLLHSWSHLLEVS